MECHRCPHSEAITLGKYRRVPFEQTPCAQCELVEDSCRTIEYDEERGDARAVAGAAAARDEEVLPVSVLSEAVAELLSMPPGVRDVVAWRYAGMSYPEIGAALGMTAGAAENRLRRAMPRWPALRALFALKAAKQLRRGRGIVNVRP